MKRFNKMAKGFSALVLFAGALCMVFSQETGDWKKDTDNNGNIIKMTLTNPKTTLGIEKEMAFDVDPSGKPTGNAIKFNSGFERPMTPDEVRIYWEKFNGAGVVWDSWQSRGKLNTMTSGQIPNDWFGNETRIITNENAAIIGKLSSSSTPGEYLIDVDHACCGPIHFTFGGIRQLQQVKR